MGHRVGRCCMELTREVHVEWMSMGKLLYFSRAETAVLQALSMHRRQEKGVCASEVYEGDSAYNAHSRDAMRVGRAVKDVRHLHSGRKSSVSPLELYL